MRVKSQIERTIRKTVEIETNGFDVDPLQMIEVGRQIADLTIWLNLDELHYMTLAFDSERGEFHSIIIKRDGYVFTFELDEDFELYTLVNMRKEE